MYSKANVKRYELYIKMYGGIFEPLIDNAPNPIRYREKPLRLLRYFFEKKTYILKTSDISRDAEVIGIAQSAWHKSRG